MKLYFVQNGEIFLYLPLLKSPWLPFSCFKEAWHVHSNAKHPKASKISNDLKSPSSEETSDEEILEPEDPDDAGGGYIEGCTIRLRLFIQLSLGHIPTSIMDENHGGHGHWESISWWYLSL